MRQFDSEEIGPWSRLHGDLDAQLMIVGQDWGGVKYYKDNKGLDKLANPTMRNLETLLHHIGIRVSVTSYAEEARGLFLTNAVLCLKKRWPSGEDRTRVGVELWFAVSAAAN
ncbi:MAG: hypothetical protein ACKO2L_15670 [Planctomycetaceae bacterium]